MLELAAAISRATEVKTLSDWELFEAREWHRARERGLRAENLPHDIPVRFVPHRERILETIAAIGRARQDHLTYEERQKVAPWEPGGNGCCR